MLAKAKTPYPVSAFGNEYTRREWREVPAGVPQKQLDDYANVLEYRAEKIPEIDQLITMLGSAMTETPEQSLVTPEVPPEPIGNVSRRKRK